MKKINPSGLIFSAVLFLGFVVLSGSMMTAGYGSHGSSANLNIMSGQPREFINFILNEDYEARDHNAWVLKFLDRYKDSLHFNSIQYYNYYHHSSYYGSYDALMDSSQIENNNNLFDSIGNKGLKVLSERNSISKYCYGQRLIYEAEGGNDGFSYQTRAANPIEDQGRMVVHLSPYPTTDATPRWLCKDIYENLQHTDLWDFTHLDEYDWFLKPVMRIDTSVFSVSNTTPVVAVVVTSYEGDVIDSIVVRVNNFRDGNDNYNGSYLEKYTFDGPEYPLVTSGNRETGLGKGRPGEWWTWKENCKVDFKVWWFGEVEVWFDKMIVDDERGHDLFSGIRDTLIQQQVAELGDHAALFAFYADEMAYSNIECVRYVDSIMKSERPDAKLHTAVTNWFQTMGLKNNTIGHRAYFQAVQLHSFNADAHELYVDENGNGVLLPDNISITDSRVPQSWKSTSYSQYTNKFQDALGDKQATAQYWAGSLIYQVNLARSQRDQYSPGTQFIMQPQIHSVLFKRESEEQFSRGLREPINEEIQVQAMVSIAHGAEGLCWFLYPSIRNSPEDASFKPYFPMWIFDPLDLDPELKYIYGLTALYEDENSLPPRYSNMYGQDKWNYVKQMNIKIENWKPVLDATNWVSGWSVHSEGANNEFVQDIKSIYRDPQLDYQEINTDPSNERYWEMGFFNPEDVSDKGKYFMMVNRRCYPEITAGEGDLRQLKIKFDSVSLSGFTNWKVIDINTDVEVAVFDKTAGEYVNFGIFQPGEGKLYKIAPVMQEGGTLVCDEVTGETFTCKGVVLNDGNNITLTPGATISFAEQGKIAMTGGEFKSGNSESENSAQVTLKAKDEAWDGLTLTECSLVDIYQTVFRDIRDYERYYTALTVNNPHVLKVISCTFANTGGDNNSIDVDYNFTEQPREIYAVINNNNFHSHGATMLGIYCSGSSSVDLQIQWNNFTNPYAGNLTTGLVLSGASGAVVKNNTFNELSTAVKTLNSTVDYYNNLIYSTYTGYGLHLVSTSHATMSSPQDLFFGGNNFFNNEHTYSTNLKVENSTFDIADGYNYFDIAASGPTPRYHLNGYFPSPGFGSDPAPVEAHHNCFKLSGDPTEEPVVDVTWGVSGDPVSFIFEEFDCSGAEEYNVGLIVDLGEGFYDTIYSKSGGSSGGQSGGNSTLTYPQLLNEMYLLTRKREYEDLYEICEQLLQNFPDSSATSDALSRIYLAALKTDNEGNVISSLKTFLEQLILNTGDNAKLVEKSFYLIQKCKAALGDYSSALTGFQQIINNNPYSYEALLASWDYSAVSLHQGGGSSGAKGMMGQSAESMERSAENMERSAGSGIPSLLFDDRNDRYDQKVFTKEDRKVIFENTKTVTQKTRENSVEKYEELQEKTLKGDKRAEKELRVMNALKESARIFKPKNTKEHFERIKQDVNTIAKLTTPEGTMDLTGGEIIPIEYKLEQNYPNPFNPTTKISFDLPIDTRVTLKVFDITGREIAVLLNNEFRTTGRYTMDFTAKGIASGVYFYRLEAKDFIQTKRMVLVK